MCGMDGSYGIEAATAVDAGEAMADGVRSLATRPGVWAGTMTRLI